MDKYQICSEGLSREDYNEHLKECIEETIITLDREGVFNSIK